MSRPWYGRVATGIFAATDLDGPRTAAIFINVFLELNAAEVPVSLREYLTLIGGMIKAPDGEDGRLDVIRQSIVSFWMPERHEQTLMKRLNKPTVWR